MNGGTKRRAETTGSGWKVRKRSCCDVDEMSWASDSIQAGWHEAVGERADPESQPQPFPSAADAVACIVPDSRRLSSARDTLGCSCPVWGCLFEDKQPKKRKKVKRKTYRHTEFCCLDPPTDPSRLGCFINFTTSDRILSRSSHHWYRHPIRSASRLRNFVVVLCGLVDLHSFTQLPAVPGLRCSMLYSKLAGPFNYRILLICERPEIGEIDYKPHTLPNESILFLTPCYKPDWQQHKTTTLDNDPTEQKEETGEMRCWGFHDAGPSISNL